MCESAPTRCAIEHRAIALATVRYRECLLGGGGTKAAVAGFLTLTDDRAEKGAIRAALDEGLYADVSSSNVYLTFAQQEMGRQSTKRLRRPKAGR